MADTAGGWLLTALVFVAPGVVATLLWAPFLVAKRVRALFAALPPTDSVVPSYAVVGVTASIPYVAGVLVVLATVDPADAGLSNAVLGLTVALSVLYVAGAPLLGVVVLPSLGVDWDRTGYGASTWVLLAAGGGWYAAVFAVPFVLLSVVFALPGGY
ncbi:hypothetical protein GRX01_04540 [Halobaculum sp. WSA2]|uniref:DUF8162 domain-containing protein n=2 Tax=Halobaculum saliterrae TaxID=2073113 RepID=A0A6B0SPI5_9EURY|nr:hypothetical protein [Halobaculum saliterrae]